MLIMPLAGKFAGRYGERAFTGGLTGALWVGAGLSALGIVGAALVPAARRREPSTAGVRPVLTTELEPA
jgi:hypothetical protein